MIHASAGSLAEGEDDKCGNHTGGAGSIAPIYSGGSAWILGWRQQVSLWIPEALLSDPAALEAFADVFIVATQFFPGTLLKCHVN